MKKNNVIVILLIAMSVSGCGAMIGKMIVSSYPTSTYNVFNVTEEDVNNHYAQLEKIKGQVVKDEKGSYFYKKENDGIFLRFALLNEDGSFLKSSFSSSIGLMEPVYSYDNNAELQLDWEKTKRQYKFFTKKVGLKLLPLKSTRKYHNLVVKSGKNRVFSLKEGFSGEHGLFNPRFYSEILLGDLKKATYLISNWNTDYYYSSLSRASNNHKGMLHYSAATKKMNNFYNLSINFIPVTYFKNLKKGGAIRFYSGCQINSKSAELDSITFNNESTSIPYYSGIVSAINDKDESQITLAKNKFYQALKDVENNRLLVERSCKEGFKSMSLSGIIDSKKLH